jgi:farnesyl-diphosphate farnesyltransferase
MPLLGSNAPKHLLKRVSRSFYLTLRVLPGSIRHQVGLAYLLARTTDTIADTRFVPVQQRLAALHEMRGAILTAAEGNLTKAPDFGELAAAQDTPAGQGSLAERTLLANAHHTLNLLRCLPDDDRQRIRHLLETIIHGQEMDLIRFGEASADQVFALETDAELEEYEYLVAGCVGEFWTHVCLAHQFSLSQQKESSLLANGIRFGKGLQLVNILRDLPRDLWQGRCYLPRIRLSEYGLTPQALLNTSAMDHLRPLYEAYLKQAEEHLRAGWIYTNALPHSQIRIRLACSWPILIGMKTLASLRSGNVLDENSRIKVSRSVVRRLILRSIICYPNSAAWDRLIDRAGN